MGIQQLTWLKCGDCTCIPTFNSGIEWNSFIKHCTGINESMEDMTWGWEIQRYCCNVTSHLFIFIYSLYCISVTAPMCQSPMSALKDLAPRNTIARRVKKSVEHEFKLSVVSSSLGSGERFHHIQNRRGLTKSHAFDVFYIPSSNVSVRAVPLISRYFDLCILAWCARSRFPGAKLRWTIWIISIFVETSSTGPNTSKQP